MKKIESEDTHFDRFASEYDEALRKGISISGEDKDFFASRRIQWLCDTLSKRDFFPSRICDFGCGTGSASPHVFRQFPFATLIGADISMKSLEIARTSHGNKNTIFISISELSKEAPCDLVFCNGVFHHIPLRDRPAAVQAITNILRPGGYFALFENNPYNPGTRFIMKRCPFDDDAILVAPSEAIALHRSVSLEIVLTRYLFIFPHFLHFLRPLEKPLSPLPFGAQYVVIGRKPTK